jgi:hypothetical protein
MDGRSFGLTPRTISIEASSSDAMSQTASFEDFSFVSTRSSSLSGHFTSSAGEESRPKETDTESMSLFPIRYKQASATSGSETSKMTSKHEAFENIVATFVDVASVMIAYAIGMQQSNFLLGVGYALFDAFIVVWMRKPLSNLIRSVLAFRGGGAIGDAYVADLK